jgi:hypothetical protein
VIDARTKEGPGSTAVLEPRTAVRVMTGDTQETIADAIDGAEEIRDPLDGLVERTEADPGAPFAPEVLERLAALKKEDRAAFEALRAQLKSAGCRVTELDEAIAEENGETGGRGPTQADILINLAQSAELFHAPDGTGFADLDINGHRETWPIRTKGFRRWLARRFFKATQGAPSSEALQSALNVIEAKAHFDAPQRIVHIRVGGLDERLYLDLGDATWRAVEIDATGWRVIENPPVRFRRAAGMQPLLVPVAGGSIEVLRSFLNVQSDNDFVLAVAWALAGLRNRGPIIRSWRCPASKDRPSPPSRPSCGRCSIPTPRPCEPCRARIATCSSPRATAMCSPSTTCRACRPGFPTRSAGLRPAAASRCGSFTRTWTRCCSMPPGR